MARIAKVFCPTCTRELQIRPEHVGRRVACKFCAGPFRVPSHVMIPCPACGRDGKVRTEHVGAKIRCRHCGHSARAVLKPPAAAPEIARLRDALAAKDAELAAIARRLEAARDGRTAPDIEATDAFRKTQEWSVPDGPEDEGAETKTRTDLPLAVPDDAEPGPPSEARTAMLPGGGDDLTRTELVPAEALRVVELRSERDRLRAELAELRERMDQTVLTTSGPEEMERELQAARADNVRLIAERDEATEAVEAWKSLVRERDAALAESASARESERSALATESDRLRRDLGSASAAIREVEARAAADRDRAEAGRVELARRLLEAESAIPPVLARCESAEAAESDLRTRAEAAEAARDDLARRLSGAESSLAEHDGRVAHLLDEHDGRVAGLLDERSELIARAERSEAEGADLAERLGCAEADGRTLAATAEAASAELAARRANEADVLARFSDATGRLREATDRTDRADRDLASARSRIADLERERASAPSAPATTDPPDQAQFHQLLRERDQARRDVARLRSMLDDLGGGRPAVGLIRREAALARGDEGTNRAPDRVTWPPISRGARPASRPESPEESP